MGTECTFCSGTFGAWVPLYAEMAQESVWRWGYAAPPGVTCETQGTSYQKTGSHVHNTPGSSWVTFVINLGTGLPDVCNIWGQMSI